MSGCRVFEVIVVIAHEAQWHHLSTIFPVSPARDGAYATPCLNNLSSQCVFPMCESIS